jgi:hypothetical protein
MLFFFIFFTTVPPRPGFPGLGFVKKGNPSSASGLLQNPWASSAAMASPCPTYVRLLLEETENTSSKMKTCLVGEAIVLQRIKQPTLFLP